MNDHNGVVNLTDYSDSDSTDDSYVPDYPDVPMPILSLHPRRPLGPALTPYGRRPPSSTSDAHGGDQGSEESPSMPKRHRAHGGDQGDEEVRVIGQSTRNVGPSMPKRHKFKNPFYKKVKLKETIVIPSDEDEVKIEEIIILESDDEGNVNPQPTSPPLFLCPP